MNLNDNLVTEEQLWRIERTQLAWIRTSFGLGSAAVALDKGTAALSKARLLDGEGWVGGGYIGGIILASYAAVQLLIATLIYVRRDRELATAANFPTSIMPVAVPLSILVTLLCITVTVMLFSRS